MSFIETVIYPFSFFVSMIIDYLSDFAPFVAVVASCLICGIVMLIVSLLRGVKHG